MWFLCVLARERCFCLRVICEEKKTLWPGKNQAVSRMPVANLTGLEKDDSCRHSTELLERPRNCRSCDALRSLQQWSVWRRQHRQTDGVDDRRKGAEAPYQGQATQRMPSRPCSEPSRSCGEGNDWRHGIGECEPQLFCCVFCGGCCYRQLRRCIRWTGCAVAACIVNLFGELAPGCRCRWLASLACIVGCICGDAQVRAEEGEEESPAKRPN